jgi:uncharacterized protein (DUF433 family)
MPMADRITVDPARCGGRPCIRDLRVRVTDVLDLLAAGASREEILTDCPRYDVLALPDVYATLAFYLRHQVEVDAYLAREREAGDEARAEHATAEIPLRRMERDIESLIVDGEVLDRAMVATQRHVILRHRALGLPLVLWRDGKVVEVSPFSVELPEEDPMFPSSRGGVS